MPDAATRADSIRYRNTGAATHEASQSTADNSLGKHIASSADEIIGINATRPSPITGDITVDLVGWANGEGTGTLQATGADALTWTAPSGAQGTAVTITSGQTKILEDANDTAKFVRVTRTSATGLSGSESVTLAYAFNNTPGFDNISSAEAAAGDNEYRCIGLINKNADDVDNIKAWVNPIGTQATTDGGQLSASGAGSVTTSSDSFADWPASGFAQIQTNAGAQREIIYYSSRTDTVLTVPAAGRGLLGSSAGAGASDDEIYAVPPIRIGIDAPTAQPNGQFVDNTGVGEGTAPSGIVFSQPIKQADALSIGTLQQDEIYGIWVHRGVPVGQTAIASVLNDISVSYDAA